MSLSLAGRPLGGTYFSPCFSPGGRHFLLSTPLFVPHSAQLAHSSTMTSRSEGKLQRELGCSHGKTRNWYEKRQRGSGRNRNPPEICRNFQRMGRCRFDSKCHYSHDLAPGNGLEQASDKSAYLETHEQRQAKDEYHSWKRLIKVPPQLNCEKTLVQVWIGALTVLDGQEREWRQMVVRDLDEEDFFGKMHIKAVLARRPESGNTRAYFQLIQPFLSVMTHSALLDCLSVDSSVGGLYNFISGTNGTRAVPFVQTVCETLVNLHLDTMTSIPASQSEITLIASTTFLREVLRRESRARFNDDIPTVIESLQNAVQVIVGQTPSCCPTIVLGHLDEVQAMVGRAKGLLIQEEHAEVLHTTTFTSAYPHVGVIPRDRHDNDKTDIATIKIFPTREEILSDETEFLPSTDLDQPHFLSNQAERHIDTHFRLLRYDTFGQLKELLGNVIHAVEEDYAGTRLNSTDFRANQYAEAHISYVALDQRRGLEFDVSFVQPSAIRKKSVAERRKWWEDSKRLNEGVLMSFVSKQAGAVQHLFFIVTNRNTDSSRGSGLTKREQLATITAKLTSHDQMIVQTAVSLSQQKARGLLFEFPGILPATFIPILENLQSMQRLCRLPFHQWILPEKTGGNGEATAMRIPPPLYALAPGFNFSLKPILRLGYPQTEEMFVDTAASADDSTILDRIEAHTHLDRGQCRALVAALTQEFAFIQGPPGTGKSYLGVELMKVIMHRKQTVELGPVVIV